MTFICFKIKFNCFEFRSYFLLAARFIYLFFSNPILFLFVIDTDCEKQLISPLKFVNFFRPPHCWQQTHENETIATTYSRNLPC
jgi:hypothetical protein